MYSVNISDIAEGDIFSSVEYIANVFKAPKAANNLLDEIAKYEKILADTPNIYPFVLDEYLAEKGLKFVKVKNFLMLYTVNEDKKNVTVIRFLHSRRDWKHLIEISEIDK